MRRFASVLFVLVCTLASAQESPEPDLTKYEVLAEVLRSRSMPDLIIVDVRSPDLYREGHIPGAVNIPLERIYSDYPSNSARTPLLVYGRPASSDARKAVDILRIRGYKHVILFGSITQWEGELQ